VNATLSILTVGTGDTTLSFDKDKPLERERAARIVADMLKRGYAILVKAGEDKDGEPLYARAKAFDANTCEYLISGLSPAEEAKIAASLGEPAPKPLKGRGLRYRRLPAGSAPAYAVARSAGGCAREPW
jgi:hypothetical protein